ncbi:hypothetical protein ACL02U_08135 [Streptomyces sp. MS06]
MEVGHGLGLPSLTVGIVIALLTGVEAWWTGSARVRGDPGG